MAKPQGSVMPFVVSWGGEDFLLDRDIEKARSWVGRQVTFVDGHDLKAHELVDLCEYQSDDLRTIILDNAEKVKADKHLKAFIEGKSPSDTSTVLVAIVRSEKLPEVWSAAVSKGKGYERKKLKTWDNGREYLNWMLFEAEKMHLSFETGIDQLIYQFVGPDLYRLHNELKKLAILVGGGRATKDHVLLVVSPSPQSDSFMVADAILAREPKKAMNLLSILFKNEGEVALVPLVGALMKQLERLIVVRHFLDQGTSESDTASMIGMKEWPFRQFVLPLARKHEVSSLVGHMERLCRLDVDVKGPARSKRTLVELAALAIAG